MDWFDANLTQKLLLGVQALHLLHHRIAKRHISFAEVVSGFILCIPVQSFEFPRLLAIAHLAMATIQIVGSLFIKKLSPDWPKENQV